MYYPSLFQKHMTRVKRGQIVGSFWEPENPGMKCKIQHFSSRAGVEEREITELVGESR
jgi:hypothetical protein